VLVVFYLGTAAVQLIGWGLHVTAFELPPRIGGALWNANNLAFVLVPLILMAIEAKEVPLTIILAGFLLLTASYVNFLALIVGLTVYAIRQKIIPWAWTKIAGLAILALTIVSLTYALQWPNRNHSFESRAMFAVMALVMGAERPLVGWGPWSTLAYHASMIDIFPQPYVMAHAHSFPLNMMAETGIVGTIALGFLLVAFWQGARRSSHGAAWPILAALIVSTLFDYYFWVPATGILAGLVWLIIDPERRPVAWPLVMMASIGIVIVWILSQSQDLRAVLY
jgi:hypothetical protein